MRIRFRPNMYFVLFWMEIRLFPFRQVITLQFWVICVLFGCDHTRETKRMNERKRDSERAKCYAINEKHVVFKSPAIFYSVLRTAFFIYDSTCDKLRRANGIEFGFYFLEKFLFGIDNGVGWPIYLEIFWFDLNLIDV